MDLAFHYSGSFNKKTSLSEMIAEVEEIAEINHWDYTVFGRTFPAQASQTRTPQGKLYGICLTPPGCDPVWLTFLSNGRLSSPLHVHLFGRPTPGNTTQYLYKLSTQTQQAGVHTHVLVIDLLKYLAAKYFKTISVSDEGQYWETGDAKVLESKFNAY